MTVYELFSQLYADKICRTWLKDTLLSIRIVNSMYDFKPPYWKTVGKFKEDIDDLLKRLSKITPEQSSDCTVFIKKSVSFGGDYYSESPFDKTDVYDVFYAKNDDFMNPTDCVETYAIDFEKTDRVFGMNIAQTSIDQHGGVYCLAMIIDEVCSLGATDEQKQDFIEQLKQEVDNIDLSQCIPGDKALKYLKKERYASYTSKDQIKYAKAYDKFLEKTSSIRTKQILKECNINKSLSEQMFANERKIIMEKKNAEAGE